MRARPLLVVALPLLAACQPRPVDAVVADFADGAVAVSHGGNDYRVSFGVADAWYRFRLRQECPELVDAELTLNGAPFDFERTATQPTGPASRACASPSFCAGAGDASAPSYCTGPDGPAFGDVDATLLLADDTHAIEVVLAAPAALRTAVPRVPLAELSAGGTLVLDWQPASDELLAVELVADEDVFSATVDDDEKTITVALPELARWEGELWLRVTWRLTLVGCEGVASCEAFDDWVDVRLDLPVPTR